MVSGDSRIWFHLGMKTVLEKYESRQSGGVSQEPEYDGEDEDDIPLAEAKKTPRAVGQPKVLCRSKIRHAYLMISSVDLNVGIPVSSSAESANMTCLWRRRDTVKLVVFLAQNHIGLLMLVGATMRLGLTMTRMESMFHALLRNKLQRS